VPSVATLFWSFRIMVGLGFLFLILMATFFYLSMTRGFERRPALLKFAICCVPLPWLAAELGWIVAEMGRQPWVIDGVLPTAVAYSDLSVTTVLFTIACFVALYTVLLIIEFKLMIKAIRKGPSVDTSAHAPVLVPRLSQRLIPGDPS